jgi:hypothetical protein
MDKGIIAILMAVAGVFFFASGFQSAYTENWAGQRCGVEMCIRPEWIAIGFGLVAFAFYQWTRRAD